MGRGNGELRGRGDDRSRISNCGFRIGRTGGGPRMIEGGVGRREADTENRGTGETAEKSLDRYCCIEYRVARISPRIHANRTGTEALPPGYDFNSNISHAETQSPQRILGVRGYEGWHRNRIGRIVPDSSGLLLSEKWPVSSAHSACLCVAPVCRCTRQAGADRRLRVSNRNVRVQRSSI
jgi:hypothetical protein